MTTIGLLQTAFIVNPLKANQSTWWAQTYTMPDVALNHPSRWRLEKDPLASPIPSNCLTWDGSSQMDCMFKNYDTPSDPWISVFHQLRGLFISSANNRNQGPQLGSAINGNQLALTTRVYNYSVTAMPAGSMVHARYGQQWQTIDQRRSQQYANRQQFLIGETAIDPIPPSIR